MRSAFPAVPLAALPSIRIAQRFDIRIPATSKK
jgi:hypothetical protein